MYTNTRLNQYPSSVSPQTHPSFSLVRESPESHNSTPRRIPGTLYKVDKAILPCVATHYFLHNWLSTRDGFCGASRVVLTPILDRQWIYPGRASSPCLVSNLASVGLREARSEIVGGVRYSSLILSFLIEARYYNSSF